MAASTASACLRRLSPFVYSHNNSQASARFGMKRQTSTGAASQQATSGHGKSSGLVDNNAEGVRQFQPRVATTLGFQTTQKARGARNDPRCANPGLNLVNAFGVSVQRWRGN